MVTHHRPKSHNPVYVAVILVPNNFAVSTCSYENKCANKDCLRFSSTLPKKGALKPSFGDQGNGNGHI